MRAYDSEFAMNRTQLNISRFIIDTLPVKTATLLFVSGDESVVTAGDHARA
ncbi:hypothetical protein [Roseiflexus sp.]